MRVGRGQSSHNHEFTKSEKSNFMKKIYPLLSDTLVQMCVIICFYFNISMRDGVHLTLEAFHKPHILAADAKVKTNDFSFEKANEEQDFVTARIHKNYQKNVENL